MGVRDFRKRYISFIVEPPGVRDRKSMIQHLNRIGRQAGIRLTLTVFEDNRGIVLVKHTEQKAAIQAMNSYPDLKIRTIRTSGTIKKAKASLI